MTLQISSVQNARIKAAVGLRERRERERSGLMLVEGYHELLLALECGMAPKEVFYCPHHLRPGEEALLAALAHDRVPVVEVTAPVMAKLAYRENPDAWLAVAPAPKRHLTELQLGASPLLVVAETVEKPGNLGAILRSADAAGADAVIICDRATDLYNPNVVRASKGTIFRVPVVEASSQETLAWLKKQGIRSVAATPAATVDFWSVDLSGGIAVAVGTEKEGLSALWMEQAELQVAIPMFGAVNSLNVAQALTLLVYEARRQRTQG